MKRFAEWVRDTAMDYVRWMNIGVGAADVLTGILRRDFSMCCIGGLFIMFGLYVCPWMKRSLYHMSGEPDPDSD